MKTDNSKIIGELVKVEFQNIHLTSNILELCLKLDTESALSEEVLYEWLQYAKDIPELKDIYLIDFSNFKSQLAIMERKTEIPVTFTMGYNLFIPVKTIEKIEASTLKRTFELTDLGKVIDSFSLNFRDYQNDFGGPDNFFKLDDNQIILNGSIFIPDSISPSLKLTGKAAEIAKKKEVLHDRSR